jgi:hypothetical protein
VLRKDNVFADMLLNSRIAPPTRSPASEAPSDEAFEIC